MQKVAIVSFTETASDPRVLRQIQALSLVADLTIYGFGKPPDKPIRFVSLANESPWPEYTWARKLLDGALLALMLHKVYYWRTTRAKLARKVEIRKDCDIYIANDFESLPFVLKMAPSDAKVFLDAHEYTPDQAPRDKWYSLLIHKYLSDWLVKKHIKLVAGMMTVAPGIADAYSEKYGVAKPVVIMNTPNFENLPVRPTSADRIRLIHHGVASPRRGLRLLIDLMDKLDGRFELNLMLVDDGAGYLNELKGWAQNSVRSGDINFHAPVRTQEIASYINQFDLGVLLYPPLTLNEHLSLPNKFFEFLQARLGIVVGPSPEMSRIVRQYALGVVGDDFEISGVAKVLNGITMEDVEGFKFQSDKVAMVYSWERNADLILKELGLR